MLIMIIVPAKIQFKDQRWTLCGFSMAKSKSLNLLSQCKREGRSRMEILIWKVGVKLFIFPAVQWSKKKAFMRNRRLRAKISGSGLTPNTKLDQRLMVKRRKRSKSFKRRNQKRSKWASCLRSVGKVHDTTMTVTSNWTTTMRSMTERICPNWATIMVRR